MANFDPDEALFHGERGALKFALNHEHGGVDRTPAAKLAALEGRASGRALGGYDGAGQAGMILAAVERLPTVRQAIIVARYAERYKPCPCKRPCCSGRTLNPVWATAVDRLTDAVMIARCFGTKSHYRLRQAMVYRYLDQTVSFKDIAEACGVNRNTASASYSKVVDFLKDQEKSARAQLAETLRGGVVQA
jgi:hypothetical protein